MPRRKQGRHVHGLLSMQQYDRGKVERIIISGRLHERKMTTT